uniref:Succinate dehydrogenase assembly factor 4, mitochondrial n=2 Tax=Physcomitrium patens TaxID=3218 RepID=A0A7I4CGM8_PHYPA
MFALSQPISINILPVMALQLRKMLVGLSITRSLTFKCAEGVAPSSRIPWLHSSRLFASVDASNEGKRKSNEDEGHRVTVEGGDASPSKEDMDDHDGGGLDINTETGEVGGPHGPEPTRLC